MAFLLRDTKPTLSSGHKSLLHSWLNTAPLFLGLDKVNDIAISEQMKQKIPGVVMSFKMGDCKPENLRVGIKDGVLHVESKEALQDGFKYIRYEKRIPDGVHSNALPASLLADGTLVLKIENESSSVPIAHL